MIIEGKFSICVYLDIEGKLGDVDVLSFYAVRSDCGPQPLRYSWE